MTTIIIGRELLEQALGQLICNTNNMQKGMSKSIQKLCARENAEVLERLRTALAAPATAPATAPEQCWCRTCRPITQADNRMVLCPDCGNKRCPKATDHRNACTGSNEPGQPGSSYPTVPVTAPEHLDPADLCDVCKEPVRYGSRHHACGEAMLRAKANAAPATAPDELERLRQIAHLTGTIFCYGNFVAETHNEAVLEKLLRENGTFWDSVEQYEKSQGWIP